jgi:hypothetical protein
MDARERADDDEEGLRMMQRGWQSRVWTAIPGIIESFNAQQMTVSVQPAVMGRARQQDGSYLPLQMPVLPSCPVLWMGGGGVTGVYPIAQGDECLLLFSARDIDTWWSQGVSGNGTGAMPASPRMHNLSDGFALVGVRSLPRVFTPPAGVAGLVTDDGQTYITLNPSTKAVAAQASGGISLNGFAIDQNGNATTPGNFTAQGTVTGETDVVAAGISGKSHTHTSASPGSPTSPPIGA